MAHVDRVVLSLSCSLSAAEHGGDRSFLPACEDLRVFGEGGKIVCLETRHCLRILSWDAAKKSMQTHRLNLCFRVIYIPSLWQT